MPTAACGEISRVSEFQAVNFEREQTSVCLYQRAAHSNNTTWPAAARGLPYLDTMVSVHHWTFAADFDDIAY